MLYQLLAQAAADAPKETPSGWMQYEPVGFIIVIMVIMYFLLIHPQRKKDKQRNEMRKNLKKNDKVVTIGGMHGIVKSVTEDEVLLLVDEVKDVKIRMSRQSILSVEDRSAEEELSK